MINATITNITTNGLMLRVYATFSDGLETQYDLDGKIKQEEVENFIRSKLIEKQEVIDNAASMKKLINQIIEVK